MRSINELPDPLRLVVVDDGGGLLVVRCQSFAQRLDVVVRSLDEGLARYVVRHGFLRRARRSRMFSREIGGLGGMKEIGQGHVVMGRYDRRRFEKAEHVSHTTGREVVKE